MILRARTPARTLGGRAVYLSTGMPQESPDLEFEVEEAVISLSRAVFASWGRLVLVADDALAPLVAQLGLEYAEPPLLETAHELERRPGPVVLLLHRELEEPTVDVLTLLQRTGAVDLLTDAEGERLAPWTPGLPLPALPEARLRQQLIELTRPVAVVAIGEPPQWRADAELTAGLGVPAFRIETTTQSEAWRGVRGEVVDAMTRYITPELLRQAGLDGDEGIDQEHGGAAQPAAGAPYPFVMQCIVDTLHEATGLASE